MDSLWMRVRQLLQQNLSTDEFFQWIEPLKEKTLDRGRLILHAPTRFHYDWIQEHYLELIRSCCHRLNHAVHITLVERPRELKPLEAGEAAFQSLPISTDFESSYSLSTFCVAPFNRFAFAAVQAVCHQTTLAYNPLYIEGPLGLGKTHLLHAIGNFVTPVGTSTPVYLDCRKLMRYGQSHLDLPPGTFRHPLASVKVLLVDNVHLLPADANFQHHLLDIFDKLYNLERQMVFTGNRLPNKISELMLGLRSRLSWGLIARIAEPDSDDCIQVIKGLFTAVGLSSPPQLSRLLAEKRPFNFQSMRETVHKLQGFVENGGSLSEIRQIQTVLENSRNSQQGISIQAIQQAVSDAFTVSLEALLGTGKNRAMVNARQVGMYLSRKLTGSTYAAIGSHFGGRDHSTVIYACRKVSSEKNRSRDFAERIVEVEKNLLKSYKC
jgi:chromosomal replication initiator protein